MLTLILTTILTMTVRAAMPSTAPAVDIERCVTMQNFDSKPMKVRSS
jgi:hypothetical protein